MYIKSEKELYEEDLVQKYYDFDNFVWGESLTDKKLVIYPKKLKEMDGYGLLKGNLKPCGLVLIENRKSEYIRCISATVNMQTGNVYISEKVFNSVWRIFRKSVNTGINIMREQLGTCNIAKPEDILILDHLQRYGSRPFLCNNVIKYEPRELTEEERHMNSRKQSLIDNPKMLYYYSEGSEYYHDKECVVVKEMSPYEIMASEKLPEGRKVCPKCQRKVYFRKACYPNTKQIAICDRIFKNNYVSLRLIEHFVMTSEMHFHATDLDVLQVVGAKDTWFIKGLKVKEDKLELWHNNYIRTSPTERYITNGYHNQNVERATLGQMLKYIEDYSWQKHLEAEVKRQGNAEEELVHEEQLNIESGDNIEIVETVETVETVESVESAESAVASTQVENSARSTDKDRWYVRLWNLIKKIVGR